MNNAQLRSFNDRFDEQIKQCDHDLKKMLLDCQYLKDEQHNDADHYSLKFFILILNN